MVSANEAMDVCKAGVNNDGRGCRPRLFLAIGGGGASSGPSPALVGFMTPGWCRCMICENTPSAAEGEEVEGRIAVAGGDGLLKWKSGVVFWMRLRRGL